MVRHWVVLVRLLHTTLRYMDAHWTYKRHMLLPSLLGFARLGLLSLVPMPSKVLQTPKLFAMHYPSLLPYSCMTTPLTSLSHAHGTSGRFCILIISEGALHTA